MTEVSLIQTAEKYNGQPFVQVRHITSGATADVTLHGGQLISFKTGGPYSTEVLYKSATSPIPGKGVKGAIRGGTPICLPQFGDGYTLQDPLAVSHGFARLLKWEHVPDQKHAVVMLTSKSVRQQFEELNVTDMAVPFGLDFTFIVKVSITADNTLDMTLTVQNAQSSKMPFPFTTCLHTYFSVSSMNNVRLDGAYEKLDYLDTAQKRLKCEADELHFIKDGARVDRIYYGGAKTRNPLSQPAATISDGGRNTQIQIFFRNIDDLVIWNPGSKLAFKDMPEGDHDKFVCIEGCVIQPPQILAPGQTWEGGQVLKAVNTSNQEISRL